MWTCVYAYAYGCASVCVQYLVVVLLEEVALVS